MAVGREEIGRVLPLVLGGICIRGGVGGGAYNKFHCNKQVRNTQTCLI